MDIPHAIEAIPDSWNLQYALMILTLFILLLIAIIKAAYMKDLQNEEPWFEFQHTENKVVTFMELWMTTAVSIMISGVDPGVGSATWYVFDKGIDHIESESLKLVVLWGLACCLLLLILWRVHVIKGQITDQFYRNAKLYISIHAMICPLQRRIHKRMLARHNLAKTKLEAHQNETTPLKQADFDHEIAGGTDHEGDEADGHWQLSG